MAKATCFMFKTKFTASVIANMLLKFNFTITFSQLPILGCGIVEIEKKINAEHYEKNKALE